MSFGSKNQLSMRCNGQLSETVFIVHQVIERKTGKRAWSRQFLKERAMRPARRIVVSASAKVAAAQPWFQLHIIPLVAGFGRKRVCAMSQHPPRSGLDRRPEYDIGFAAPQRKN